MTCRSAPVVFRERADVLIAATLIGLAAIGLSRVVSAEDEPSSQAATNPAESPRRSELFSAGVLLERNIAYVPHGDDAQRLDLYLPEQPAESPLPLIIHIHGGGWMGGSKFPCPFIFLVSQGYAVASVEYRFSQNALFPAQIQDCQAAIRWLRANSKRYNVDPKNFGVVGASAGGHLSALAATSGGKRALSPDRRKRRTVGPSSMCMRHFRSCQLCHGDATGG